MQNYKIEITDLAEKDLEDIDSYIEEQRLVMNG